MQKNIRESNLDLLRILCCIAVVVLHISSRFKAAITDPGVIGSLITENIPAILLLDTITRFAVPCFVMLAGAFALGNEKNGDYRSYYRKTFRAIGIPMLVFSLLYVAYDMLFWIKPVLAGYVSPAVLLEPVKAWILGAPYYHMWYLYTMIGLYILTPVLVRWKNSVSQKTFRWCAFVLLVLCTVSGWTSQQKFYWDLGRMFCYTGYYVMGYVLRDLLMQKKRLWKSAASIVGALLILLVITGIQYRHSMQGIAEGQEAYSVIGSFNPLIVLASLLMFAGFCQMKTNVNCDWFVKRSFLIYLIHAGVLTRVIGWSLHGDPRYHVAMILATACAVLIASFLLALVYEKLWGILEQKWNLSDRLTDLILPEKKEKGSA